MRVRSMRHSKTRCLIDSLPIQAERQNDPRLKRPVFIIGASRSGTTILGELLKHHQHIHCTVERDPIFSYNLTIAINLARVRRSPQRTLDKLKTLYTRNWRPIIQNCDSWRCKCEQRFFEEGASRPRCCWAGKDVRVFIDKSQPIVLYPDLILRIYPDARFILIQRDARDVVASMLRHWGVMGWFKRANRVLKRDNFPNPWYGVEDASQLASWRKLPIASKAAIRWATWASAGERWWLANPERVHRLAYEELIQSPEETLRGVTKFLGLERCDQLDHAAGQLFQQSVGGWRKKLSSDELESVQRHAGEVMEQLGYSLTNEPINHSGAVSAT